VKGEHHVVFHKSENLIQIHLLVQDPHMFVGLFVCFANLHHRMIIVWRGGRALTCNDKAKKIASEIIKALHLSFSFLEIHGTQATKMATFRFVVTDWDWAGEDLCGSRAMLLKAHRDTTSRRSRALWCCSICM
jgi:hypothetical protein